LWRFVVVVVQGNLFFGNFAGNESFPAKCHSSQQILPANSPCKFSQQILPAKFPTENLTVSSKPSKIGETISQRATTRDGQIPAIFPDGAV
jgi:hypothetical protein